MGLPRVGRRRLAGAGSHGLSPYDKETKVPIAEIHSAIAHTKNGAQKAGGPVASPAEDRVVHLACLSAGRSPLGYAGRWR